MLGRHLYLIGMPGSGKSSLGKRVAKETGLAFADMDSLIQNKLRKALDYEDYREALMEIQDLFWKDCPLVCLYYRNGAILSRFMFTDARDVREPEVLRGIQEFRR